MADLRELWGQTPRRKKGLSTNTQIVESIGFDAEMRFDYTDTRIFENLLEKRMQNEIFSTQRDRARLMVECEDLEAKIDEDEAGRTKKHKQSRGELRGIGLQVRAGRAELVWRLLTWDFQASVEPPKTGGDSRPSSPPSRDLCSFHGSQLALISRVKVYLPFPDVLVLAFYSKGRGIAREDLARQGAQSYSFARNLFENQESPK
ncbi:hypothetical protein CIRG_08750 [Coccidioides immitis RMSCC 2394]|uniref:Uncharacterized protein n=1 Tax=Coccidioides immitis RMSCC 2394 TaxID=404692 RepID=A0A0J6YPE8_COCIT|nr:hypothetical protein CIRG_08750 [Coccidioides immitis RMSCC 2394]